MFKQDTKPKVQLVTILLFMAVAGLYGQQESTNIQELSQNALNSFNQGSYRTALNDFRDLLELNGNDPMYSYYTGRCLVELNEELPEAIELLYSSSKQSVPADAVLYLGRAYHLSYNFQDARNYYESYNRMASKQERKTHNLKHLIATCLSASEITSSYNPFESLV